MSTSMNSPAPVSEPHSGSFLDRLIPVCPRWRIPPRKADRSGRLQLVIGLALFLGSLAIPALLLWIAGFAPFNAGGDLVSLSSCATMIMDVVDAVVSVAGYWLLVHFVGGRPVIELGGRGAALREFSVGLAIGALLMSAVIAILALIGFYHVVDVGWSMGVVTDLGAGVFVGVAEEIFFRGILLRLIEGRLGTWWALAITSTLFGAAHLGNSHATVFGAVAIALEAGILLGACYLLTRRLWMAIGVHIAWNFVQGGIFGIGAGRGLIKARLTGPDLLTGDAMGIEGSVVAVVLCAASGLAVLVAVRRRGLIVPPCWRRPAQAALDSTQPA